MMTAPRLKTADDILDALGGIDTQAVRYELKKLRGIHEWAMSNLGVDYKVGDQVVLKRSFGRTKGSGWFGYREALTEGATAVVKEIDFSPGFDADHPPRWIVSIVLDREWYVSDYPRDNPTRYWNGPVSETPEGMDPPSKYDQEQHPEGRRHVFMLEVTDVRRVSPEEPPSCDECGQSLP